MICTFNKPNGPSQTTIDLALDPSWGNKANKWDEIEVPVGTELYIGKASKVVNQQKGIVLPGGGRQVSITKPYRSVF